MFDLTGKRALVTGGSGGIGLGMARGLARAGADVEIWGRNPGKLAAAAEDLKRFDGRVLTRSVDVSDERAVTDGVRICAGRATPIRIGPTGSASASTLII